MYFYFIVQFNFKWQVMFMAQMLRIVFIAAGPIKNDGNYAQRTAKSMPGIMHSCTIENKTL